MRVPLSAVGGRIAEGQNPHFQRPQARRSTVRRSGRLIRDIVATSSNQPASPRAPVSPRCVAASSPTLVFMTPWRPRAARLCSILALASVSWAVTLLLVTSLDGLVIALANALTSLNIWLLLFSVFVVSTAVCVPLSAGRVATFLGLHLLWRYTPLWVAIVLAAGLHSFTILLGEWPSALLSAHPPSSILYGIWIAIGTLGVGGVTAACISRVRDLTSTQHGIDSTAPEPSLDDVTADPTHLLDWLKDDDRPIRCPSQDVLGYRDFAIRIAARLTAPTESTMLIRGPKGCGKTSLCYLVGHHLSAMPCDGLRVHLVHVSAWEFDNSASLLAGVLTAIKDTVHEVADAYALIGLPSAYVAAVSSGSEWLSWLTTALSPDHEPSDALDRISDILQATNVRVVIWLDDLERFYEGAEGSSEPVRALLSLIRDRSHLSFVLSEADSATPSGRFDYPKLCSYIDTVPTVPALILSRLVYSFSEHLRTEVSFVDLVAHFDNDTTLGAPGLWDEHSQSGTIEMSPWVAIGRTIRTPRNLKRVLRRLREAWNQLRGEVLIEELLVCIVLQESDRVVHIDHTNPAFVGEFYNTPAMTVPLLTLLDEYVTMLQTRSYKDADDSQQLSHSQAFRAFMHIVNNTDDPQGRLIRFLFPRHLARRHPQSVTHGTGTVLRRQTDYWKRIREERVNDDSRDQPVLLVLKSLNETCEETDNHGSMNAKLMQWFRSGHPNAYKVAQFAAILTQETVVHLVHAIIHDLTTPHLSFSQDDHGCPYGFMAAKDLLQDRDIDPSIHLFILQEGIRRAMPHNLAIVHWLEYHFGTLLLDYASSNERNLIRHTIAETFVSTFGGPDGAKLLAGAISRERPYELSWLIERKWDRDERHDSAQMDPWSSAATVLLEAAEQFPSIVGRSLALAYSSESMTADSRHPSDIVISENRQSLGSIIFHAGSAEIVFGPQLPRLMRVFAAFSEHDFQVSEFARLLPLKRFAKAWLTDHSP